MSRPRIVIFYRQYSPPFTQPRPCGGARCRSRTPPFHRTEELRRSRCRAGLRLGTGPQRSAATGGSHRRRNRKRGRADRRHARLQGRLYGPVQTRDRLHHAGPADRQTCRLDRDGRRGTPRARGRACAAAALRLLRRSDPSDSNLCFGCGFHGKRWRGRACPDGCRHPHSAGTPRRTSSPASFPGRPAAPRLRMRAAHAVN